jgi:predicted transglutaminase-like cysteine proteinase
MLVAITRMETKSVPVASPRLAAVLLACSATLFAPAALAGPDAPRDRRFMAAGELADAPAGFIDMCRRDAVLCAGGHTPQPQVPLAPLAAGAPLQGATAALSDRAPARTAAHAGDRRGSAEYRLLRRINNKVNGRVRQVSDLVSTGQEEYWRRTGTSRRAMGDCEDLAIEKRMRLIEAGFDPERLFFAIAFKTGFGLHTVLVARTAGGDLVLDSMAPRILPWHSVRYSWLRIQATDDPLKWSRVALG